MEDHQLVDLLEAVVAMASVQGVGDAIPWLAFPDNWLLPKAKFRQIKRQLDNYFARVIQEHRREQAANPGLPPRDFVDVLLRISDSEVDGEAVTEAMIASLLTVSPYTMPTGARVRKTQPCRDLTLCCAVCVGAEPTRAPTPPSGQWRSWYGTRFCWSTRCKSWTRWWAPHGQSRTRTFPTCLSCTPW